MSNTLYYRRTFVILLAMIFVSASFFTLHAKDKDEDKPKGTFLGVYPTDLEKEDAEALNYSGKGVLLESIVDDGPAEKAGFEAGDIVIEMDGEKVKDTGDLRKVLKKHKPGDKIDIVFVRDGETKKLSVELGEPPKENLAFNFNWTGSSGGFLGVETITLEDDLAEYFEVDEGALIKKIVEDSPAEKAGLKAGDVLVKIADEEIESTDDVALVVGGKKPDEEVMVDYVRKGKKASVKVTLGKSSWPKSMVFSGSGMSVVPPYIDHAEIERAIHEAMKGLQFNTQEREALREELDQLRKEMEMLKEEMKNKQSK